MCYCVCDVMITGAGANGEDKARPGNKHAKDSKRKATSTTTKPPEFFAKLKHQLRNRDMVCIGKADSEEECGHMLGSRASIKFREGTGQLVLNRHLACGYHVPSEEWLEKNGLRREQVPTFAPASSKRT